MLCLKTLSLMKILLIQPYVGFVCCLTISNIFVYFANVLTFTQIFVGGLDSEVNDEDLRQTFIQCGEILSVKIPIGKGCGFVRFANRYLFIVSFVFIFNGVVFVNLYMIFCLFINYT